MVSVDRNLLLLVTAVVNQGMASLLRALPVEEEWSELLAYYASGRRDSLEVALERWNALRVHKEDCSQGSWHGVVEKEIGRIQYMWLFTGLSQKRAIQYKFRDSDIRFIYCVMKELGDILLGSSMPENKQVDQLRKDLWYCLCILERRAVYLRGRQIAMKVEHFHAAHWRQYLTVQEIMEQ